MPRELVLLPIDEIPPADENPKDHDIPGIVQSLQEFGFIDPPAIDARTGKLVGGHGRVEALQWMRDHELTPPEGIEPDWLAPVVTGWASIDDEHAIAAAIALNRYVERGGWLPEILTHQLVIIEQGPIPLAALGFTHEDVLAMSQALAEPDFGPTVEPSARLDQRNPVECPHCGTSFYMGADGRAVVVTEGD